jgi:nucleoside-diphosphate-sugar epimerase
VIAITGATGYVGRLLCAALEGRGQTVRRLTRRPEAARGDAFFALEAPVPAGALAGVESLIHAAYDFRPAREADLRRLNVDGSRRLLEAARREGVRRVLFISSIASYGGSHSAYGRVKWTLEQDVAALGGTSLRPGLIFGRERGGLFAALDRVVRRAPFVPDFGPSARLYVVHAGDLTRIVGACLERAAGAGQAPLAAAWAEPYTMRRVLEIIAEAAARRVRFLPAPPPLALAGLRALEAAGLRLPFRSDSLVSMLHGNPAPGLTAEVLGVPLRPLDARTLSE